MISFLLDRKREILTKAFVEVVSVGRTNVKGETWIRIGGRLLSFSHLTIDITDIPG